MIQLNVRHRLRILTSDSADSHSLFRDQALIAPLVSNQNSVSPFSTSSFFVTSSKCNNGNLTPLAVQPCRQGQREDHHGSCGSFPRGPRQVRRQHRLSSRRASCRIPSPRSLDGPSTKQSHSKNVETVLGP